MANVEQRGYRKFSEVKPDQAIEAEMANDEASETWTGPLDPVQQSEHRPFWWRPARGKDDLWMEIMALRGTETVKIR